MANQHQLDRLCNSTRKQWNKFRKGTKEYIDLTRTSLPGSSFDGYDFEEVDFALSDLSGSNLLGVYAPEANFAGSKLVDCVLCNSELFAINASHCDMRNADLRGCNLQEAVLDNAILRNVNAGPFPIGWVRTVLEYADMDYADLSGGNFRECLMYRATMHGAITLDADMRWIDWDGPGNE